MGGGAACSKCKTAHFAMQQTMGTLFNSREEGAHICVVELPALNMTNLSQVWASNMVLGGLDILHRPYGEGVIVPMLFASMGDAAFRSALADCFSAWMSAAYASPPGSPLHTLVDGTGAHAPRLWCMRSALVHSQASLPSRMSRSPAGDRCGFRRAGGSKTENLTRPSSCGEFVLPLLTLKAVKDVPRSVAPCGGQRSVGLFAFCPRCRHGITAQSCRAPAAERAASCRVPGCWWLSRDHNRCREHRGRAVPYVFGSL